MGLCQLRGVEGSHTFPRSSFHFGRRVLSLQTDVWEAYLFSLPYVYNEVFRGSFILHSHFQLDILTENVLRRNA